jgi:hypothetical protein
MVAMTLAAGCGSKDGDDLTGAGTNPGGSFNAALTGGVVGSYSGLSTAVPSVGLFSIGMSSADGKFALAFTRNGSRPAPGDFQLGSNPQNGFAATLTVSINNGQVQYNSTNGTLSIASATATEIKGSFSFTATAPPGTAAALNVSGTFTSVCPVGC